MISMVTITPQGSFYPKNTQPPTSLMDANSVVVQDRKVKWTPYGIELVNDGKPYKVICSVEGRANQAGMFANSGARDTNMTASGGQNEITTIQIIARQWTGNYYSLIWFEGDLYDTVGSPVYRNSGTNESKHVEIHCQRVGNHLFHPDPEIRKHGFPNPLQESVL